MSDQLTSGGADQGLASRLAIRCKSNHLLKGLQMCAVLSHTFSEWGKSLHIICIWFYVLYMCFSGKRTKSYYNNCRKLFWDMNKLWRPWELNILWHKEIHAKMQMEQKFFRYWTGLDRVMWYSLQSQQFPPWAGTWWQQESKTPLTGRNLEQKPAPRGQLSASTGWVQREKEREIEREWVHF